MKQPRHAKRAAAEKRQARWDKLTTAEKLSDLNRRGMTATKQRIRIMNSD